MYLRCQSALRFGQSRVTMVSYALAELFVLPRDRGLVSLVLRLQFGYEVLS